MLIFYWFINSILLLSTAIYCFHKYMSKNYNYWKNKNVYYIEPSPIFGNFLDVFLLRTTVEDYFIKLYSQTKESVLGIFVFHRPALVINNPEIIKSVLMKDFNYFSDRYVLSSPHDPISSKMLFFSKNPDWKITRAKVTPLFTSGKLKMFIPHMNNSGKNAVKYLEKNATSCSTEAKEICGKYTTDVIAKCAFGYDANSFENENAEFRKFGRRFVTFTFSKAIIQTSYFFLPALAKFFRIKFVDDKTASFLRHVFWQAIDEREKNNVKGNDLIDMIIEIKQNKEFSQKFNFVGDTVIAQATQFFFAGFETSSSTMAFALYELCLAPKIQQRLRNEIQTALRENIELTYEVIKNMKYLHMVFCETLRKYPILPFLDRVCNADYKISETDLIIEKGIPVFIPVSGLHNDPQYFPNPEVFDPERFSSENIHNILPSSYFPFGEGPRNCVGERFGLLSTKIGLINILSEFEVERNPNTPVPIRMDRKSLNPASDIGLPMKFKKCLVDQI